MVIGDRRKFLSALVTLDVEAVTAWANNKGLGTEGIHAHPDLLAEVQQWIDKEVNPQLARVEWVRKFALLPRDFNIDSGELTPTLKIKRRVVNQNWEAEIERMYAGSDVD